MSASFLLELDTTPPMVTLGVPYRDAQGTLHVPYTTDEDGVVSATLLNAGSMDVLPGELTRANAPSTGTVIAHARDDVWNEADTEAGYTLGSRFATHFAGAIRRPKRGRIVRVHRGRIR